MWHAIDMGKISKSGFDGILKLAVSQDLFTVFGD